MAVVEDGEFNLKEKRGHPKTLEDLKVAVGPVKPRIHFLEYLVLI